MLGQASGYEDGSGQEQAPAPGLATADAMVELSSTSSALSGPEVQTFDSFDSSCRPLSVDSILFGHSRCPQGRTFDFVEGLDMPVDGEGRLVVTQVTANGGRAVTQWRDEFYGVSIFEAPEDVAMAPLLGQTDPSKDDAAFFLSFSREQGTHLVSGLPCPLLLPRARDTASLDPTPLPRVSILEEGRFLLLFYASMEGRQTDTEYVLFDNGHGLQVGFKTEVEDGAVSVKFGLLHPGGGSAMAHVCGGHDGLFAVQLQKEKGEEHILVTLSKMGVQLGSFKLPEEPSRLLKEALMATSKMTVGCDCGGENCFEGRLGYIYFGKEHMGETELGQFSSKVLRNVLEVPNFCGDGNVQDGEQCDLSVCTGIPAAVIQNKKNANLAICRQNEGAYCSCNCKVECPPIETVLENGERFLVEDNGRHAGGFADLRCKSPLHPPVPLSVESDRVFCGLHEPGKWSTPVLSCHNACDLEEEPWWTEAGAQEMYEIIVDAQAEGGGTKVRSGSHLTVRCKSGFHSPVGTPNFQPMSCVDGKFEAKTLLCLEVCPEPAALGEGFHMASSERYAGATRELTCSSGHKSPILNQDGWTLDQQTLVCDRGSFTKSAIECPTPCAPLRFSEAQEDFIDFIDISPLSVLTHEARPGSKLAARCKQPSQMEALDPSSGRSVPDPLELTCTGGKWPPLPLKCSFGCHVYTSDSEGVLSDQVPPVVSEAEQAQLSEEEVERAQRDERLSMLIPRGSEVTLSCDTANGYFTPVGSPPDAGTEKVECLGGDMGYAPSNLKCFRACFDRPTVAPSLEEDVQAGVPLEAPYLHGIQLRFLCAEGYSAGNALEEKGITQCDHGKWTPLAFDCFPDCPRFPYLGELASRRLELAERSEEEVEEMTKHGSKVTVRCEKGLVGLGRSSGATFEDVECLHGAWTPLRLSCSPACLPYVAPFPREAYVVSGGGLSHGETRTVTCASGFEAVDGPEEGEEEVMCVHGHFTPQFLICGKECPSFEIPEEGMEIASVVFPEAASNLTEAENATLDSMEQLPHGTKIGLRCQASHTPASEGMPGGLAAVDEVVCMGGRYTRPELSCKEKCPVPVLPGDTYALPLTPISLPFGIGEVALAADGGEEHEQGSGTEEGPGSFIQKTVETKVGGKSESKKDNLTKGGIKSAGGDDSHREKEREPTVQSFGIGLDLPMPGRVSGNRKEDPHDEHEQEDHKQGEEGTEETGGEGGEAPAVSATGTGSDENDDSEVGTPTGETRHSSDSDSGIVHVAHGARLSVRCRETLSPFPESLQPEIISCNDGSFSSPQLLCFPGCPAYPNAHGTPHSALVSLPKTLEIVRGAGGPQDASLSVTPHGQTIALRCAAGYTNVVKSTEHEPHVSVQCLRGKWTAASLSCRANCLPFQEILPAGTVDRYDVTVSEVSPIKDRSATGFLRSTTESVLIHSTNLKVKCADGFSPTGLKSLSKLAWPKFDAEAECVDGSWSPLDFRCEPNCGSFPQLPEGMRSDFDPEDSLSTTEFNGASRIVSCVINPAQHPDLQIQHAPGYFGLQSRNSERSVCVNGLWTQVSLACLPNCPTYEVPDASRYEVKEDPGPKEDANLHQHIFGARRTVACKTGFGDFRIGRTGPQEEEIRCEHGRWTQLKLDCQPLCYTGLFPYTKRRHRMNVTVPHDFYFDGEWVFTDCAKPFIRWPQIAPPEDFDERELEEARAMVPEDIYRKQDRIVRCERGKWSPLPFAACMAPCPDYDFFDERQIIEDPLLGLAHPHNSQLMVKCKENHLSVNVRAEVHVGNEETETEETLTCMDGQWTKQTLKCRQTCEAAPPSTERYEVRLPERVDGFDGPDVEAAAVLWHGAARVVACKDPYKPVGVSPHNIIKCLNGEWTPITLMCKKDCPLIENLINATSTSVSSSDVHHGARVFLSCKEGHSSKKGWPNPAGNEAVTCDDGEWTAPRIECKRNCPRYRDWLREHDPEVLGEYVDVVGSRLAPQGDRSIAFRPSPLKFERYFMLNEHLFSHGHAIGLSCALGFEPSVGAQRRHEMINCVDGEWESRSLKCKKSCDAVYMPPSMPSYLQIPQQFEFLYGGSQETPYLLLPEPQDQTSPAPDGTKVLVTCKPFWESTNPSISIESITCVDGRWTDQRLVCEPMCPEVSPSPGLVVGEYTADSGGPVTLQERHVHFPGFVEPQRVAMYAPGTRTSVVCDETSHSYEPRSAEKNQTVICSRGSFSIPQFQCIKLCPEVSEAEVSVPLVIPSVYDSTYFSSEERRRELRQHGSAYYSKCVTEGGAQGVQQKSCFFGKWLESKCLELVKFGLFAGSLTLAEGQTQGHLSSVPDSEEKRQEAWLKGKLQDVL